LSPSYDISFQEREGRAGQTRVLDTISSKSLSCIKFTDFMVSRTVQRRCFKTIGLASSVSLITTSSIKSTTATSVCPQAGERAETGW
jgi:hypothetical protein